MVEIVTSRVAKFFGLEEESKRVLYLAKVATAWMPLAALAFSMSSTFYAIFVALLLSPTDIIMGFAIVGVLAAISMAIQMAISYACFGLVFFLTAFGVFFPYFWFYILVYAVTAIAAAFNSGALTAWFDNNYRVAAKDPKRKAYSKAQGRMGMLFQIASTSVLIPGAVLAVLVQPTGVFLIQAVLCGLLCFSALFLFRDFPEVIANRPKRSIRSYFSILKAGLKFSVSSRLISFFLIGTVIISSTVVVWADMILFLIYYQYLGQNIVAIAVFRTLLFGFSVLWIERAGIWTRNLFPAKWIPRSRILQTCGPLFYFVFAVIYFFMPPLEVFIPFPFMYIQLSTLLICAGFVLSGIFTSFSNILNQRLMLDLIPDEIRNGIYSLIPTLTLLMAVPQFLFFVPILIAYGPPAVLCGLGIVCFVGVLILALGLQKVPKKPVAIDEEIITTEESSPRPSKMP
jgi:hypothetical protein